MHRYELHFCYDSYFRGVQEFHHILNLLAVRHLLFYLQGSVKDTVLTIEDQTVRIGDMLLNFLFDTGNAHHGAIDADVFVWIAANDDIGWYIF